MSIKFQGRTIAGNLGVLMDRKIYHALLQDDGRTYVIQEDMTFIPNEVRFIHFDNVNTQPNPIIKYGWITANNPGLYSKEIVDWTRRNLDAYVIQSNSLITVGLTDDINNKLQMLFFDVVTKSRLDVMENAYIKKDGSTTMNPGYIPENARDVITKEWLTEQLNNLAVGSPIYNTLQFEEIEVLNMTDLIEQTHRHNHDGVYAKAGESMTCVKLTEYTLNVTVNL